MKNKGGRPPSPNKGKRMTIYIQKEHIIFASVLGKRGELSRTINDLFRIYRGMPPKHQVEDGQ